MVRAGLVKLLLFDSPLAVSYSFLSQTLGYRYVVCSSLSIHYPHLLLHILLLLFLNIQHSSFQSSSLYYTSYSPPPSHQFLILIFHPVFLPSSTFFASFLSSLSFLLVPRPFLSFFPILVLHYSGQCVGFCSLQVFIISLSFLLCGFSICLCIVYNVYMPAIKYIKTSLLFSCSVIYKSCINLQQRFHSYACLERNYWTC